MSCCGWNCHSTQVNTDTNRITVQNVEQTKVESPALPQETGETHIKHAEHCRNDDNLSTGSCSTASKISKLAEPKKRKSRDTRDEGQENGLEIDAGLDIFEFLAPSDLRLTPKALIETHISHFRCNVNGENN